MTLVKALIPIVIRDIPVSASDLVISLFVLHVESHSLHSPARKPQMTNTRHPAALITELSLSGFSHLLIISP